MKYFQADQSFSLGGKVCVPPSKSHSIRAILLSLLARGDSFLFNVLEAEDTSAALEACAALGLKILRQTNKDLALSSQGPPFTLFSEEINTGNSGISTNFLLPLLGLRKDSSSAVLLRCGLQMQARPVQGLIDALASLGMEIHYLKKKGYLPLSIRGALEGGNTSVDGITSQYLSALLLSLPCAKNDSTILVKDLCERPYLDMTLAWLTEQGIVYTQEKEGPWDFFKIPGQQQYKPVNARIKGDFSSASCLLAAASLLPGEVAFEGLDCSDSQGDKRLLEILSQMGADLCLSSDIISIKGGKSLQGCEIDAKEIPDLVPALAVIATQAQGKTRILNVKQARIKETDRIHSMIEGLRQLGAQIEEYPDGMEINTSCLKGALVRGYGDHRTVMALSLAGILAEGSTLITDPEAIQKTYPCYARDFQNLGAKLQLRQAGTNSHIVLLGFKHVGKTKVGEAVAKQLKRIFIDCDEVIAYLYRQAKGKTLSCRQIMAEEGEAYYRHLESQALQACLDLPLSSVLAIGGGAVLVPAHRRLLAEQQLFQVIAEPGIVFERIMAGGIPAFFDPKKDPFESFNDLWQAREKIYQSLKAYPVHNNGTIEEAVAELVQYLKKQGLIKANAQEASHEN